MLTNMLSTHKGPGLHAEPDPGANLWLKPILSFHCIWSQSKTFTSSVHIRDRSQSETLISFPLTKTACKMGK